MPCICGRRVYMSEVVPMETRHQSPPNPPLNPIPGQKPRGLMLIRYLANLSNSRLLLWCYFIWYLVVLARYFEPNARLWLTSLGLSFIIGLALFISTATAGAVRVKLERWQVFRLFLMPFCVSSFSALGKRKGFVLVFSPKPA